MMTGPETPPINIELGEATYFNLNADGCDVLLLKKPQSSLGTEQPSIRAWITSNTTGAILSYAFAFVDVFLFCGLPKRSDGLIDMSRAVGCDRRNLNLCRRAVSRRQQHAHELRKVQGLLMLDPRPDTTADPSVSDPGAFHQESWREDSYDQATARASF